MMDENYAKAYWFAFMCLFLLAILLTSCTPRRRAAAQAPIAAVTNSVNYNCVRDEQSESSWRCWTLNRAGEIAMREKMCGDGQVCTLEQFGTIWNLERQK